MVPGVSRPLHCVFFHIVMNEKKLFLLDAYALIYRAYYAMMRSPRITSKGVNTSAVFGFVNTLEDVLKKENPSHIAVCFDPKGGHTFRHELYPEYKAQREKQPEDITVAIPYIKEILSAYNIPVIEIEGYEADDVIGTLSRMAEAEGYTSFMMTPDKDYGQLVTDRVFMYRPALKGKDFEIRGPKQVCERYGIESPAQVIDLLALEGDASDNVPGCPGVGEKTAAKLITEFGSVENILSNVDKLKGALKTKIESNSEQILFSKVLVTIKTDVPVDLTIDQLERRPVDTDRLRRVYEELEFKSFLRNMPGAEADKMPAAPTSPQGSLFDFDFIAEPSPVRESIVKIADADAIADIVAAQSQDDTAMVGISVYSVGEEAMTAEIRGIAISFSREQCHFLPIPDAAALEAIKPLFGGKALIASHDVKRDMILLKNRGIEWTAPYFDTSVAHYLLQPEMRHNLEDLAFNYLRLNIEPTDRKKRFPAVGPDAAPALFGRRADIMRRLIAPLQKELAGNGLLKLFEEVETPFVRVLASMEWVGVRVDVPELNELSVKFTARLREMEERCHQLAGHPFNIGSPKQVGDVLFDEMKIDPKAKRTKTGSYSTTEEILEKFAHQYEIVDLILKIRGLSKLLATYINALPLLINPATGKIHTTYNQTVTATGRISSTNPNLQNIPIRTEDGREIRRAFIPDPGNIFLSADYSQIELRLMADLSGDPDMIEAFREGYDIHRSTAAKIYHLPIEEVTDNQRRNAKTANFGIIYGISAFGLSERLGIPRSEAKMLIDGYFESYPHISEYIENAKATAREKGYVTTIMGRKRYLPDINSRNAVVRNYAERNAVNAPIQGSAADVIKVAMNRIFAEMDKRAMRSRMIMQVHDELIFNVVPDELADLQQLIVEEMERAYSGRVRLEVASGTGRNWMEAH